MSLALTGIVTQCNWRYGNPWGTQNGKQMMKYELWCYDAKPYTIACSVVTQVQKGEVCILIQVVILALSWLIMDTYFRGYPVEECNT